MLAELDSKDRIVGIKQLKKALSDGRARKVFVALDADPRLVDPIVAQCRDQGVELEEAPSMEALGKACGIEVGASVAALIEKPGA